MCFSGISDSPEEQLNGIQVCVAQFLLVKTSEDEFHNLVAGAVGSPDTHGQYPDMGKVASSRRQT